MNRERLLEICRTISQYMQDDVDKYDGAPFTGETVAAMHGELAATIAALADVTAKILEEM